MSYLHIPNLYRPEAQGLLALDEVYALEKIHGTSAHVRWDGHAVHLFSGGAKHEAFAGIFNGVAAPAVEMLAAVFGLRYPGEKVYVYGEAYGGSMQGMRKTYGDALRFVAFDVLVGEEEASGGQRVGWLNVPEAEALVLALGLEFVSYRRVPSIVEALNVERDRPSAQALRNGIAEPRISEGIVIRPLVEMNDVRGNRVIAKHKRAEFSERKTIPDVDPTKLALLEASEAIAGEWVTEMRLEHVLDKLGNPTDERATGDVIKAMVEDVCREASGEIVESKAARKAIGSRAAKLYRQRLMRALNATGGAK